MDCDPCSSPTPTEKPPDLLEGVPSLNAFYLYLTNGCNLFCRHCWITPTLVNGKPSPGDCMDPEHLRKAVADAKPLGLCQAKLTGGEPLLHPQFREIVGFLSSQDLPLTIETNGTLIDAALALYLKQQTTVWHVSVSLDSIHPKSHDRFRGKKGAFESAVQGVRHLVSAGFHPQIIMSPHRGNLHEVEGMVRMAEELGAGSVKFNPVTNCGRGAEMNEKGETLDFEEVMALVRRVHGPLQGGSNIRLHIMVPPALLTVGELLRTQEFGGTCQVLHILGLLGSGEMALCGIGRNIPDLCFGKLGKDELREVWIHHPTLNQLRADLAGTFPGICGNCIHAERCLTHCVAQNYLERGQLVAPSPLCEEALARGSFPATRCRKPPAQEHTTHAAKG